MGKAIVVGAVSAAVSFGIGRVANAISEAVTLGKVLFQVGAHGTFNGMMNVIEGANFLSGFAAGAVSSLLSSGVQALNNISDSMRDVLTLAAGGLSGGIASTIAGGSFWKGLSQGIFVSGLNHLAHRATRSLFDKQDKTELKPEDQNDPPTKREKLEESIDVTDKILKSTEAMSALEEYISTARKTQPNRILGKSGKIAGNVSNITSVAVSGIEYANGNISGVELTFDLGTQAASIWVSSQVGASLGGPYGFAAGAATGAVAEFVVKPIYKKFLRPSIIDPIIRRINIEANRFYNQLLNSRMGY